MFEVWHQITWKIDFIADFQILFRSELI